MLPRQLLGRMNCRPRRSVQRPTVHHSHLYLESLEQRCLLAINEFPTGSGPLSKTGGPDGDL
jgi:hypothetical protein